MRDFSIFYLLLAYSSEDISDIRRRGVFLSVLEISIGAACWIPEEGEPWWAEGEEDK